MKHKLFILFIVSFAFIFSSCINSVPVRIIDYKSELGGENQIKIITKKPVTYDGKTIKGVSNKANVFTTALMYKDEEGKRITKYGTVNRIEVGHVEMVQLKKEYIDLNINRYFYKDQALLSCCLLGMIPPYIISDTIFMTVPASPYSGTGFFGDDFINGKPIDIKITIQNFGTMAMKDEFVVVDVLPDYLEVDTVKFAGDAKEVAYDLHVKGKNQILAFKVIPTEKGIAKFGMVDLKITVKPVMSKFNAPEYKWE